MLFEAEKNLVQYLKSSYETNLVSNESRRIVDLYMETIDFDEKEEVKQYVSHPVNSFHLLHRHNGAKTIIKLTLKDRGGGRIFSIEKQKSGSFFHFFKKIPQTLFQN